VSNYLAKTRDLSLYALHAHCRQEQRQFPERSRVARVKAREVGREIHHPAKNLGRDPLPLTSTKTNIEEESCNNVVRAQAATGKGFAAMETETVPWRPYQNWQQILSYA